MVNLEVVAHLAYGALRASLDVVWRQGSAPEAFVATYAEDGLAPFTEADRALAHRIQGCLECGRCEQRGISPRNLLVLARSLPDLALASDGIESLAGMDADALAEAERECPAAIPFSRLADMLSRLRPGA